MIRKEKEAEGTEEKLQEIEITPEMIEAGYQYYQDSGVTDYISVSDKVFIEGLIRAVLSVASSSRKTI